MIVELKLDKLTLIIIWKNGEVYQIIFNSVYCWKLILNDLHLKSNSNLIFVLFIWSSILKYYIPNLETRSINANFYIDEYKKLDFYILPKD